MAKAQRDHTVADIIRLRPEWWFKKQSDQTKAYDFISHIFTLMEYGQNQIASHPFIEVFGNYDVSAMEMKEINRLIATFTPKPSLELPLPPVAPRLTRLSLLSPEELRLGLKPDLSVMRETIRGHERTLASHEDEIDDYNNNIVKYRRRIHEISFQAARLSEELTRLKEKLEQGEGKGIDPDKLKLIKQIPEQWIVVEMKEHEFMIVRRKAIVISNINAASGMCKTLNLGFIGLKFDYALHCRGSFYVADNIKVSSGRVHPHISGSHLCMGNQQRRADQLQNELKVQEYFTLLESVLTTYCPDNPYVTFNDLEKHKTSGYVFLICKGATWFQKSRDALVREWALTASDAFVSRISEAFAPDFGINHKYTRLCYYSQQAISRLSAGDDAKIQALYKETQDKNLESQEIQLNLKGQELVLALRKAGIYLPARDVFVKLNASSDTSMFNGAMLRLMVLAYGSVPRGGAYLGTQWEPDYRGRSYVVKYFATGGIQYCYFSTDYPDGYNTSTFPIASREIPKDLPEVAPVPTDTTKPLDKALVEVVSDMQVTLPNVFNAEVFYEDADLDDEYDPCYDQGHDYGTDGVCTVCEAYSADYDEYIVDEEETDDIPF
jgi:hypothetical protein